VDNPEQPEHSTMAERMTDGHATLDEGWDFGTINTGPQASLECEVDDTHEATSIPSTDSAPLLSVSVASPPQTSMMDEMSEGTSSMADSNDMDKKPPRSSSLPSDQAYKPPAMPLKRPLLAEASHGRSLSYAFGTTDADPVEEPKQLNIQTTPLPRWKLEEFQQETQSELRIALMTQVPTTTIRFTRARTVTARPEQVTRDFTEAAALARLTADIFLQRPPAFASFAE